MVIGSGGEDGGAAAKKWYCYLLQQVGGGGNRTYVGATINPDRRLRQHNGEISGGASATHGSTWRRICLVEGFHCERAALQFEWSWKNHSKKLKGDAVTRRKAALQHIMALERPTLKGIPYKEYPEPLIVHWSDFSTPPVELAIQPQENVENL